MNELDRATEEYGDQCFFCNRDDELIVHYVNGIRSDRGIDNIRPCCSSCFGKIHSPSAELIEWSLKLDNPPVTEVDSDLVKQIIEDQDVRNVPMNRVTSELDVKPDIVEHTVEESTDLSQQDVSEVDKILYKNKTGETDTDVSDIHLLPDRKEIFVRNGDPNIRERLANTSHLESMHDELAIYGLSREDVWNSPYDSFDEYISALSEAVGDITPRLKDKLADYWERSETFQLRTEDGNTILESKSSDSMENVAKRNLEHHTHYTKFVDDTTLQVTNGKSGSVKSALYDAGYLVEDNRDLENGSELDISLNEDVELRDYQQSWVDQFTQNGSGTFVGPSGSGKTVASIGVMSNLDTETLIIVTKRELAKQWKQELVSKTTLSKRQIGQYHGGTKQIRPITIATYDTARKSRHRKLFNERDWGLLVLDEAHHCVAPVWKRVANIQSKSRLGLTATPVREMGESKEIYSLIGPPVGTDWHKLFNEGFVQKPTVRIHPVDWGSRKERSKYRSAKGHDKRRVAAMNEGKLDEIQTLLSENEDKNILLFVEWIDQGKLYSDEFDIPFVYGETDYDRRSKIFDKMRDGDLSRLVISRVGDEGIDLPNADMCIICSTLGSSSAQTAQRVGRTMRPSGASEAVILPTEGSNEIDFVESSTEYLAEQGIEVHFDN